MQMITDYFDIGAQRYPDRICVQSDATRMTYAEVNTASHAVGHALAKLGLDPQHIGLLAPNHPMGFVTMLGILRSGASYVPLNGRDAIDDLIWFMRFVNLSALVIHSDFVNEIPRIREGVPTLKTIIGLDRPLEQSGIAEIIQEHSGKTCEARRDLDDIALIKSSGGTTGRPKAIMQSHRALLTAYRVTAQFAQPEKDMVHLVIAPMTHAAGATAMGLSIYGARHVIAPSTDPAVILELIEKERVTFMFLPPTLLYRLLAHPDAKARDCSSLEYVRYGAAPMSVEKLRQGLSLWGPVFMQGYGQAEAPGVVTYMSREDHSREGRHLASAGRPTGACEVALMDEQGNIVGPGEKGEIVVRGELVTPGYYNNPEATAEVRRFGWHHTGDVGLFDQNGYLYIVDRIKDMIISGGFNIYPGEIEQLLWSHPAVQDCAVVGLPDPDWGERVVAVVELKPDQNVSADELIHLCRERFGSTKTPKHVEFWPTLPRSPVGKVLKREVRTQLEQQRDET